MGYSTGKILSEFKNMHRFAPKFYHTTSTHVQSYCRWSDLLNVTGSSDGGQYVFSYGCRHCSNIFILWLN